MSAQLHIQAALTPGERPPQYPLGKRLGRS